MMHTLTTKDIKPESIQQRHEYLREYEERLAKLKEQQQALQEQIEREERRYIEIKHDFQWRQLMAEVEKIRNEESSHNKNNGVGNSGITHVCNAFEDAIQKFKSSLFQPEDYGSSSVDESVIPYSDTDDYADFTVVEDVIEDALGEVESLLIANSAAQSRCLASSKSSLQPISAQKTSEDSWPSVLSNGSQTHPSPHESELSENQTTSRSSRCSDTDDSEAEYHHWRAERRRGLLLLLVLSLYVGRIEELCGFAEIPDQSDVPTADADEARDSVVATWQSLLYESKILTEDEQKEWINIVSIFLGPPFDTPH